MMNVVKSVVLVAAGVVCTVGAIAVLYVPLSRSELVIEAALITLTAVTAYGALKLEEPQLDDGVIR